MAENANLIKFLQKISGYELTGSVLEQCFFILYGTGANGKSTYLEVKQELFGNYARPTEFRTLLDKGKNSDAVRNDLAALKGLRLVTSVEVGKEQRIDESLIKQLTGGDTITARFLFKEFFDFRPEFKLELAANNKPQIRGVDHGIWRRVRLIPFEVTIPEEEQDRNLLQKLKEELPGILNWCLRGHQMWLGEGLESPPEVEEATESYRAESDFLANFIQECCWSEADEPPLGTELKVSAQELYRTYEAWCLGPGASDSVKKVKFGKMMKERGYIAQNVWFDGKQQQTYINIGLRDSARDMVSEVMGSNPSLLFP
jgi:putative DNA primase/helicase